MEDKSWLVDDGVGVVSRVFTTSDRLTGPPHPVQSSGRSALSVSVSWRRTEGSDGEAAALLVLISLLFKLQQDEGNC